MTQVGPGGWPEGYSSSILTDPGPPNIAQPAPVNPAMAPAHLAAQQQMAAQTMTPEMQQMMMMQMAQAMTPEAQQQMMAQMTQTLSPGVLCSMFPTPVKVQCPFCQATTTTTIEKKAGTVAIANAVMLTCVGCCCLVPLLWNRLKDTIHYCGNCKQEIGRHVPRTHGGRRGRRRRRRRR